MGKRALLSGAPCHVKSASNLLEVKAGPETAARLGVPIGTVVDTVELYWHRNPLARWWWRITGRKRT